MRGEPRLAPKLPVRNARLLGNKAGIDAGVYPLHQQIHLARAGIARNLGQPPVDRLGAVGHRVFFKRPPVELFLLRSEGALPVQGIPLCGQGGQFVGVDVQGCLGVGAFGAHRWIRVVRVLRPDSSLILSRSEAVR